MRGRRVDVEVETGGVRHGGKRLGRVAFAAGFENAVAGLEMAYLAVEQHCSSAVDGDSHDCHGEVGFDTVLSAGWVSGVEGSFHSEESHRLDDCRKTSVAAVGGGDEAARRSSVASDLMRKT